MPCSGTTRPGEGRGTLRGGPRAERRRRTAPNDVEDGFRRLLLGRGADLQLGRRLPRVLREAGLERVAADARFPLADPAVAALERANVLQVREELTTSAGVPAADVDRYLELMGGEGLDLTTAPLVSAWGRRPAER